MNFCPQDLAFVIPTRNRPEKMINLLESLCRQTEQVKQIVVVSSGDDISDCINEFKDRIPIKYKHCEKGGQIYQRNVGINEVDDSILLVGSLDDDLVLAPDAVEKVLKCWNTAEERTAGIGLNITNEKSHNPSLILKFLGITSKHQGVVLKSGINTSICNIDNDIHSEWLLGGATTWKKQILDEFEHKEINGKWAVGEDVIFSYPIGKKYPLIVCADAKVIHEHVNDQFSSRTVFFQKGKTFTLWKLYFVSINDDLSFFAFLYASFVISLGKMIKGIIKLDKAERKFAYGSFRGLISGTMRYLLKKDII